MRSLRFVLCLACLLSAGCLGVYKGHPETRGPRNVEERGRTDRADSVHWTRIVLGHGKNRVLMGYLKTLEPKQGGTYWVYNEYFRLIGRISPQGTTTRITLQGREEREGSFDLERAMLKLFHRKADEEVTFIPMPPPSKGPKTPPPPGSKPPAKKTG